MARQPLSKKLRFEVFKRDNFTCQYCGRRAPEVILQCDHVKPVAGGGLNDMLNLVTSCVDCNAGKGARVLSDQATLAKQVDQLAELQSRREQIEMMIEWRRGLDNVQTDAVDRAAQRWTEIAENTSELSKAGKDKLRRWIKEYGLDHVLRAMSESIDTYGRRNNDQEYDNESITWAFGKLGGVCRVMRDSADKPYLKRIFYIRGILRARLHYVDEKMVFRLLEDAAGRNIDFDSVERLAKTVRNWSQFRDAIIEFIAGHSK